MKKQNQEWPTSKALAFSQYACVFLFHERVGIILYDYLSQTADLTSDEQMSFHVDGM